MFPATRVWSGMGLRVIKISRAFSHKSTPSSTGAADNIHNDSSDGKQDIPKVRVIRPSVRLIVFSATAALMSYLRTTMNILLEP